MHDDNLYLDVSISSYFQELIDICESMKVSFCFIFSGSYGAYSKFRALDKRISVGSGEVIEGHIPDFILEKAKLESLNDYSSTVNEHFCELSKEYDIVLEKY